MKQEYISNILEMLKLFRTSFGWTSKVFFLSWEMGIVYQVPLPFFICSASLHGFCANHLILLRLWLSLSIFLCQFLIHFVSVLVRLG